MLFHDEDQLPVLPNEAEVTLATRLGDDGLRAIDEALVMQALPRWLKVARIVLHALEAGGCPVLDEAYVHLHARRVITLVNTGVLEAQGDLHRPRWSEVRLRR